MRATNRNKMLKLKMKVVSFFSIPMVMLLFTQDVSSYCWQVGWNPSFTQTPKIEQIDLATVRVSWDGIVRNRECVDQFLVKYWKIRGIRMTKNARHQRGWTEGFMLSDQVDNSVNFTDIEVTPKAPYMFQAIAREDKGTVAGVEYNKSPAILFQTSSSDDNGVSFIPGVSNELLVIIIILCLFGTIAMIGIIYKLSGFKAKEITIEEDDDDEDDLLDEKEFDDNDPKGDDPIRHIKTRFLRSSIISDITENPESQPSSRRMSTISEG